VAEGLEEARRKLDDEYGQVRRHLDRIHAAMDRIDASGPEDDIYELLKDLEDVVKEVRTGGVVGTGAKGHKKALENYRNRKVD
jgi:hypothetical protein